MDTKHSKTTRQSLNRGSSKHVKRMKQPFMLVSGEKTSDLVIKVADELEKTNGVVITTKRKKPYAVYIKDRQLIYTDTFLNQLPFLDMLEFELIARGLIDEPES